MVDKPQIEQRMLLVAKELSATHGVFFAASFLADHSVPLDAALLALTRRAKPHNSQVHNGSLLVTPLSVVIAIFEVGHMTQSLPTVGK